MSWLPDFNLDPDTFKHDNQTYQEIASSNNAYVEHLLGLIHTQSSILPFSMPRMLSRPFMRKIKKQKKNIMLVKEDQLIPCQLMEQLMMNRFNCPVDFL